jgi:small subunit ribosomal protein S6
LRRYETTFIVNPQADDAAIDRQVSAVADLIKNDGGQVLHENRIGTRRLAYPIAGLVQGFYSSLIFDAETTVLPKLERHYKLEEPYVRYLTIVYEGSVPMSEEAAKAESKPVEEAKAKPAEEKPAEEKPVEEAKTESVEEKPAEEKPVEEPKIEAAPVEEPAAPAGEPKPADDAEEEL